MKYVMTWKLVAALLASGVALQAQDATQYDRTQYMEDALRRLQAHKLDAGQLSADQDVQRLEMQLKAMQSLAPLKGSMSSDVLEMQVQKAQRLLTQLGDARIPDSALSLAARANLMAQELNFAQSGSGREDHEYQAGTSALDANKFEDAVRHFDAVITRKGSRADGAYYWKAYAQNRLARPSDALATLALLRRNFPQSRWLDEAQALEVEIHSQNGKANPEAQSNEELKLIAINSLMQSDPKQAIPILRKLLSSNQSPAIKDKAMFVLSQSGSPEAREAILEMARGGNPDLQLKAVRYINMMGSDELRNELGKIYAASNDVNLKREIIRSYLLSGSKAQLLQAAKTEKNIELRRDAVRTLAQTGGTEEIWSLYKMENSPELKEEIVHSMLLDGDSTHLLEIAKTEKDPKLRKAAINTLALTGWGKDSGALIDMYRKESDDSIKRELIKGMFLQQNAKGLVELARSEKNPELKRDIVSQLALIQSKDATDYMLEILK